MRGHSTATPAGAGCLLLPLPLPTTTGSQLNNKVALKILLDPRASATSFLTTTTVQQAAQQACWYNCWATQHTTPCCNRTNKPFQQRTVPATCRPDHCAWRIWARAADKSSLDTCWAQGKCYCRTSCCTHKADGPKGRHNRTCAAKDCCSAPHIHNSQLLPQE